MRRSIAILSGIVCLFLAVSSVHAADKYSAGSINWDTSTAVWSLTSSGTYNQVWVSNDSAIFEGSTDTVTVAEPISVSNMTLSAKTVTISGSNLNFGAGAVIDSKQIYPTNTGNPGGATHTISCGISGSPDVHVGGTQWSMTDSRAKQLSFAPSGTNTQTLGEFLLDDPNLGGQGCLIILGGSSTNNTAETFAVPNHSYDDRILKEGTGSWTITGGVADPSGYGLDVYVEGGTLIFNGTHPNPGAYSVANGRLGGNHTFGLASGDGAGSVLVKSGGIVSPGDGGTGTMTFDWGNTSAAPKFNMQDNSIYECDVSVTTNDRIHMSGHSGGVTETLELDNFVLEILDASGGEAVLARDFPVFTYDADVTVDMAGFGNTAASFDTTALDSYWLTDDLSLVDDAAGTINLSGLSRPPIWSTAVSDLAATSATFNATLLNSQQGWDVYAHWGETDGTNNYASWTNSAYVGSWTNVPVTNISYSVSTLSSPETYYYTFRASNATDTVWASPSIMFATLALPEVNNSSGGVSVTDASATLSGEMLVGGQAGAWICWGDNDGGTSSTSDWDNVVSIGTIDENDPFSTLASGLATNTTYFYRCYVLNGIGQDWADDAEAFSGTPVGGGGGGGSVNIAIYREATAGDATASSVSDMTWDTTVREDSAYQLQGDNKSIRILEGGRYLCLYNFGIYRADRLEVAASLSLAGSSLGARGKSSGYTRDGTGPNAWMAAAAIFDASANDDLILQYQRTSDADGTLLANASGITLVKLDDTLQFLAVEEVGGGQTHNADLSFAAITFDTDTVASTDTTVLDHSTSSDTDQILIKAAGKYLITYSLEFQNTAGTRRNGNTRLTLDGTEIEASRISGYTRADNSCADPVCSWVGVIDVASASPGTPAVLRLQASSEGPNTTADLLSQQGSLCITKLPDTVKTVRTVLAADVAVEGAEFAMNWPTPDEIDDDVFTHNVGTPSRIVVDTEGDYLMLASFYTYRVTDTARSVPRWRWRRNGTTTYDYGIFSQYNRGDEGSEDTWSAGQAGGFVATNMVSSDYIEVLTVDDYNTTDENNDYKADRTGLQAVQISSMLSSAVAIANLAPTNVLTWEAVLNASLTVGGNTNYAVYVHLGTSDGGTNFGWESGNFSVGSYTNSTATNETYAVSYPKSGLRAGTAYWYTFRASNDTGNAWATPSWSLTTMPATAGSVFMFR